MAGWGIVKGENHQTVGNWLEYYAVGISRGLPKDSVWQGKGN